ncbi:MAG: DNA-directed RNA polymerase subunit beta' [Chloroflexi bacterium]|nr:DNA-directed RNA polymerase subunit beta' [Chloroflexota bacterium]
MLEVNDFDAVRISLASPEQVKSWSYGEVTKPETINYRSLKPERDGLFCERIFGPTKDFECYCGKYKRIRYKGVICDKCGVEVARAKVRRERMGHIELATPVSHIWFAKGIPNRMALLLDVSPRNLERVIYFSHYIITSIDEAAREKNVQQLEQSSTQEIAKRESEVEATIAEMEQKEASVEEVNKVRQAFIKEKSQLSEKAFGEVEQLKDLRLRMLLTETQYLELKEKYGNVFVGEMGAEAVLHMLKEINLDEIRDRLLEEIHSTSGQRRKRTSKQLRVIEAFRRSANKPAWMILTVLPVLPPDLRPMVQLDGGRFATSDLNDLYRRVINRNNRLRHLLEIGAPEIIVRNEKRMLQEAVDSLIDNGRRGRAVSMSGSHMLKSLSDMLRGKQGRFRQNLLGKRVDYSGRSVIVVGPELKLHQCGLPRRMALELFKPFIIHKLVAQGLAQNIKSARRLVEKVRPEVYDILEQVVKERPVLLNRAPTLHRLSIQAFEPVLIDGSAIQVHPLVCAAFNADFDGDQMAVHIPLSKVAVREARGTMLSVHNMLLPSNGEPSVTPTLDMVLGCYYLTSVRPGAKGEGRVFNTFDEAKLSHELGIVELRAEIEIKNPERAMTGAAAGRKGVKTTVGRIIFNDALPAELGFYDKTIDKGSLKHIVTDCYRLLGDESTAKVLDSLKQLGFHYATRSGTTIAMNDITVPENKQKIMEEADERIAIIENQFRRGLITDDERRSQSIAIWMETTDRLSDVISQTLQRYGGIYMMATSGAKGNVSQITQMVGMRGLMTDPSGSIIDFPIKSSLREGLGVLEYFISTHGARKGLADTALRTSDSGYLTRRLVDVAQDIIVREENCGTTDGLWVTEPREKELLPSFPERIIGRLTAAKVTHPQTGDTILEKDTMVDEAKAEEIIAAGINKLYIRSPLSCRSRLGVCQYCYGRDLARGRLVDISTAVGIVAAQSIGEPGTQLTLRTFHTGGVVGVDITSGLPRVEELFEVRNPKGQAMISEIDGMAEITQTEEGRRIKISSTEKYRDEYPVPADWQVSVQAGQWVEAGAVLIAPPEGTPEAGGSVEVVQPVVARVSGEVAIEEGQLVINYEEKEEREYLAQAGAHIRIQNGDAVKAGQQLTDGAINPQDILHVLGREAVQQYLADEVQKVYRSQGVTINDKHIEVIVRQMLAKVGVESSGDTELLPGELINRSDYEETNAKVLAEGGEPATAQTVLLGITKASLSTSSWLAAASFQETTRVLTEAAVRGAVDRLVGLKENVIIGRLIPAHSPACQEEEKRLQAAPSERLEELPALSALLPEEEKEELREELSSLVTAEEPAATEDVFKEDNPDDESP